MNQIVILAGGKGTRLRERLGDLPKPLVDICGMPLLERQILLAKHYGYTDVLILVNYAANYIMDFCATKNNWGLNLSCIDEIEPRGTAGALLSAYDYLADEFLVMYGDTMLDVNLQRLHDFHDTHPEAAATVFLHPNDHPYDSDLVDIDEDSRIIAIYSYPHDQSGYYPNLVNAALYYIKKATLAAFRDRDGLLDFGKHLFPEMLTKGYVLFGYNSPEYIKDCGTPARLDKVCADFISGKITRANLDHSQRAVFLDRDGTINREVNYLIHHNQFELLEGAEQAIKRLNASEYRTMVITNQPVLARGECHVDDLKLIHNKMETLLGAQGAFIDRIYYCPHHPHKGYAGEVPELKIDCDCRKPKPGMIERAVADLNIALDQSWLVGDTTVDVATARAAGVRAILVETGYAGLDYRIMVTPDFVAPNLLTAVEFILDGYSRLMKLCGPLVTSIAAGTFVLIGGLSRSGKSTFAAGLKAALQARGLDAVVLSLDRWLKNAPERTAGVLGRYDLAAVAALIGQLVSRQAPLELSLPVYHKLELRRIEGAEHVEITPSTVIIFEGTVALTLTEKLPAGTPTFYVEIDETERQRRVINEYLLRGKSRQEAEAIYLARQQDEVPVVSASAIVARHRITLPPPSIN
jgi:histidinol-phosphate phosphatase family protein